jgi:GxxExxY protein
LSQGTWSHEGTKPRNGNTQFDELSNRIIGSAIKVHKTLGPGFLESIYEAALVVQLRNDGMSVETQKEVVIEYEGIQVGLHRLDLVVEGKIIVELKAAKAFEEVNVAQLLSYLKSTGLKIGLLLNFGRPTLGIKRLLF